MKTLSSKSKLIKENNTKKLIFRTYSKNFSWFSNVRRHIDSLIEPGPRENTSSIQDTNLSMYTNMRQFQSFLTKNAYDMSVNNEYDLWPHTNFGTIDNPSLIFCASSTWRMVICTGPGSEEESSTHEKMYMIIREGPIHRCIMCGQCFKLVNLKDDMYDPQNQYYSSVFTEVSSKVVSDPELMPWILNPFVSHDLNMNQSNIIPEQRSYMFVNADEADHIMTDPAYRMQKYKELEEYFFKILTVSAELERQSSYIRSSERDKVTIPKDIYETWYEVERAIQNFDRVFNRHEKLAGRSLIDPENHERRERRMNERKEARQKDNYTYFFGNLTEQEQQYRDYYESDVEETKDYELLNQIKDETYLRNSNDFKLDNYEFSESLNLITDREAVNDFLGKSLFKYKYRKVSDNKFLKRNERVITRSLERLKNNKNFTTEINQLLENHYVEGKFNISQLLSKADQVKGLDPFLNFIAEEGYNQFLDYYEDDIDEHENMTYYKDLNIREKIRFAECYENHFNLRNHLQNYYVSIPKRPYDSKMSVVKNFFEDLIDFNNRVKPITRNLAFIDKTSKYQVIGLNEKTITEDERYKKVLNFNKVGSNFIEELKNESKL